MLTDVFALVLLQLALGVAFWTAVTPSKDLSGGFFVLHGATTALCLCLLWLVLGNGGYFLRRGIERTGTIARLAAISAGGGPADGDRGDASWRGYERVSLLPFQRIFSSLSFLSSSRSSSLVRRRLEPFLSLRGIGPVWLAGGLLLGALLFGAVTWAMNVGHWYLVSSSLPFGLLVRATEAFAALAVLRAAYAIVALGVVARGSTGDAGEALAGLLDPMRDGFFFWSRVLWGLAAPLVLAPFVVKTARMKSNQAATGLLYVGLVFVLVGELLAAYLTRRSGLPV